MRVSRREKLYIGVGALILILALVYAGVIHPAQRRMHELDARIQRAKETLREIQSLKEEWRRVQADRRFVDLRIEKRGPDFSMFRYLEELAREAGVEGQIQYMRPLPVVEADTRGGLIRKGLEVSLKKVDLVGLVRYLYRIEYSVNLLAIDSLHIKPVYTSPNDMNVTLRVFTLDKA